MARACIVGPTTHELANRIIRRAGVKDPEALDLIQRLKIVLKHLISVPNTRAEAFRQAAEKRLTPKQKRRKREWQKLKEARWKLSEARRLLANRSALQSRGQVSRRGRNLPPL